jgi:hypothetical protein
VADLKRLGKAMDTLIILGATTIVLLVFVVFRISRKTTPLEQRIDDWAKRQRMTVIESEKLSDHSMDIGLPGSGSQEVRLLMRDSKGQTCEARIRFDVAVVGKDSEHVQWTRKQEHA